MVPNKWTMNPSLHKSPPRSWLGIRLRLNEKPTQEEECVCQHPDCTERRRASKVCHHPDCQDLNNKSPLHLCESCDSRCHLDETDNMHFDRHPRFDLQPQGSILARNVSTRSCPPRTSPPSDPDEEEGGGGGTERGGRKAGGMKLRRDRRRYTDDPSKECFTLKFDLNVDIDTEIVPAVKKKTLREVLGPVFERKGIELSRVDLFLDQSNTPLSLHFEAYPFGGHYIKVKARPGDELKVEQGVKDLRSLSLPNMKNSGGGSPYILAPTNEKVEHTSLTRRESVDILGQTRRTKNMTKFLGDENIPSPDSLAGLGGSLPSLPPGFDNRKNRAASRFSGFFFPGSGKEVDRVEQLNNRLQMYTFHGLPKVPPQPSFHHDSWEEEEDEPNLTLEESWQNLLENPETLSKRQFQQQEAIWELLQTEATNLKKLRVITDLFLCGLLNLQDCGLLVEVEPAKLFNNIQDLVRVHTALWNQVMLPALERARRDRSLLDPTDMHLGFQTFSSRFEPYLRYCMEEESCMEYMRTQLRDNELFKIYITWAEGNKQCNRLKLADMLAKPHQRLTKYPLLLKTILKKTDDSAAKDALLNMVVCVESFINSVDSKMLQRQEKQKLAAISARVESYEAVEGSSEEVERALREFNRIDLTAPMIDTSPEETRQLHLEGALRMKEGKDSRMEVYCFLFTDLLLITKPVKRLEKVKVIRQPLLIHNIVCKELKDPGSFVLIYLNEFKSAVAAYSFQANSTSQGRSWVDAICNLQNQLQRLRSEEARRRQARLKQRLEAAEEDEGGEESCNSTASSPRLPNKEQRSAGNSDGSTETLSVVEIEDSGASSDASALQADPGAPRYEAPSIVLSSSEPQQIPPAPETDPLDGSELDPQYRSLSMDSAYGTLSPESLLELQSRTATSEGDSTEEDGEADTEEEGGSTKAEDVTTAEEENEEEREEEEEEEEEESSFGSRLSVAHRLKPRRRPPVNFRLQSLQKLEFKSHSEDNLLQRVHEESKHSADQAPTTDVSDNSRVSKMAEGLAYSRSLTELITTNTSPYRTGRERAESHRLTSSLPASVFTDTLRRNKAQLAKNKKSKRIMGRRGSDGENTHHTGTQLHSHSLGSLDPVIPAATSSARFTWQD
ncbi:pleckstrin homology domain-containing family G member 5-like isoform X3 [Astyanax mexicanus]|uniref:Pleckstrin homology domain-containing family G member 5-like isoform X3 n=1 Tax=Astyanax mexicanus TaxID=7994 RepID=A0A8T2LIB6_ASTMX|nr:pleckstrin homology domain-containing family G member 5-like isoform X3 [Astyanax mexicanus]